MRHRRGTMRRVRPRLLIPFGPVYHWIPELAHVPRDERAAFWQRASAPRALAVNLSFTAGILAVVFAVMPVLFHWPAVVRIGGTVVLAAAWALLYLNVEDRLALRRLRMNLVAAGRCPSCGYDLRGHNGDGVRCPECGDAAG